MKPLSEELDPNDPHQAHAAELLRAGGPFRESEVSRRRVRRRLDEPRPKARVGALRPVFVAGLIVGLAGSAAAAYGVSRLIAGTETQPRDAAGQTGTTPRLLAGAPTQRRASENPEPNATPSDAEVPPPAVSLPPRPTPRVPQASVQKPAQKSHAEVQPADPRLLHQALQALRTADDPKKAAALLQKYQKSGSTGALDEEALALAIEAALANDDPRARSLARQYLAEYPQGRFRGLAVKAIGKEQTRR